MKVILCIIILSQEYTSWKKNKVMVKIESNSMYDNVSLEEALKDRKSILDSFFRIIDKVL